MSRFTNPAMQAFVAQIVDPLVFGQALIARCHGGFELRHIEDRDRPCEQLRVVPIKDVRALAQFASSGEFRPLKSAPNLPAGWRVLANTAEELESTLEQLYPGAIVDWVSARGSPVPRTNFREFAERQ